MLNKANLFTLLILASIYMSCNDMSVEALDHANLSEGSLHPEKQAKFENQTTSLPLWGSFAFPSNTGPGNNVSMLNLTVTSCSAVVNQIVQGMQSYSSLETSYLATSGWYLGQWGDYSSCNASSLVGAYTLATVKGTFEAPYEFSRGGYGYYTNGFSTAMGLCYPSNCNSTEVRNYTKELITSYATGIGWKDFTIDYYQASLDFEKSSQNTTVGYTILIVIKWVTFVAALLGILIELTRFGDRYEVKGVEDKNALHEASKFRRLEQYECVLVQRKSRCGRYLIMFSVIRNIIQMNINPRSLRTAVENEKKDAQIKPERRIAQHLKVFNGIKGSAMILMTWGFTFYIAQFSVINNNNQVIQMKKQLNFNFVTCATYTIPTFFFCSGFLQTFSLMQRDQDENVFTKANLAKYYFRKLFRYMPLNVVSLLFVLNYLPTVGNGPIWNFFAKYVGGCNDRGWWTNVLWINNLYPAKYDDKCLPYTWFIPCYVQLSMIVPLAVYLHKRLNNHLKSGIIFTVICLASIIANFIFVFFMNKGATISQEMQINDHPFFSEVFMNPLFHFSSFFFGICMSMVYIRFRRERGHVSELKNSFPSRRIEMYRNSQASRYRLYTTGILLMFASIVWQTPYMWEKPVKNNSENYKTLYKVFNSQIMQALYASLSFPLYLLGLNMILIPALCGKAQAFRWFYGSQTWTMMSHMSIGMYYCVPIVAIYYFLGTQAMINVNYPIFAYYMCGNLAFGFMIYIPLCLFIDRPIYAMLNLNRDIKEAESHEDYKLIDYLDNFRTEDFGTEEDMLNTRLAVAYCDNIKAKSGQFKYENVQRIKSKGLSEKSSVNKESVESGSSGVNGTQYEMEDDSKYQQGRDFFSIFKKKGEKGKGLNNQSIKFTVEEGGFDDLSKETQKTKTLKINRKSQDL